MQYVPLEDNHNGRENFQNNSQKFFQSKRQVTDCKMYTVSREKQQNYQY